MPRSKPHTALNSDVRADLKRLPGNIRRRMVAEIDNLEKDHRPGRSKRLALDGELRKIRRPRLDKWRVIYQLRRKTTVFRHVDTPHLRWVQVQAAPPKAVAS